MVLSRLRIRYESAPASYRFVTSRERRARKIGSASGKQLSFSPYQVLAVLRLLFEPLGQHFPVLRFKSAHSFRVRSVKFKGKKRFLVDSKTNFLDLLPFGELLRRLCLLLAEQLELLDLAPQLHVRRLQVRVARHVQLRTTLQTLRTHKMIIIALINASLIVQPSKHYPVLVCANSSFTTTKIHLKSIEYLISPPNAKMYPFPQSLHHSAHSANH